MKPLILLILFAGLSFANEEYTLPKNFSGHWIREPNVIKINFNQSAIKRLFSSISIWTEVGSDRSKIKTTKDSLNISSQIKDNEKFNQISWIPTSYAIGISGGFEFYDFTHP